MLGALYPSAQPGDGPLLEVVQTLVLCSGSFLGAPNIPVLPGDGSPFWLYNPPLLLICSSEHVKSGKWEGSSVNMPQDTERLEGDDIIKNGNESLA